MMSMIPHAVWNGGRVIVSSGFSMANLARLMSLSQNRFKFSSAFVITQLLDASLPVAAIVRMTPKGVLFVGTS